MNEWKIQIKYRLDRLMTDCWYLLLISLSPSLSLCTFCPDVADNDDGDGGGGGGWCYDGAMISSNAVSALYRQSVQLYNNISAREEMSCLLHNALSLGQLASINYQHSTPSTVFASVLHS